MSSDVGNKLGAPEYFEVAGFKSRESFGQCHTKNNCSIKSVGNYYAYEGWKPWGIIKSVKKLFVFLFLLLFFFKPQISFAEVIHSFDVNILAHKNGAMDITETINYDFESAYKHGIYRDIPLYSSVGNLYRIIKIDNVRVLKDSIDENFLLSNDSKNLNLKIGNANKTITGSHVYKISYTVSNGIGSNFADHDEIYWNATGNSWQITIEKASAKIETDFSAKLTNFICFEGPTGSKSNSCLISQNSSTASQTLYPGSGLTVVAVYPVNTFPKSILSKEPPKTFGQTLFELILKNYLYIFIVLNFGLGGYLVYWYNRHKNKKRFGEPAVNFDIPKEEKGNVIRPALAGTIDDARLDRDDVVATIFDLAIRKYIKIEETKTVRKLLPDSTKQTILKLKNADGKLNPYEKKLYDRLFETGDIVDILDLKKDFYLTFSDMEKDVFEILVEKKYYTKNPKIQKTLLLILGIFALVTLNVILAIVLWFLYVKLNGRTPLGDEIDFKIDGLKLFLKSMDRNYKWQAQNFYTVEQMIPYAIALGYINQFMEQLKIIKPDYSPTWYAGYKGSFYGAYAGFYSSMSSTVAPSSSSGAGGGGFSGGGGGGGGGGSW